MAENISTKEMYRIINRAISQCYNQSDICVSEEMEKFNSKHWDLVNNNHQTDIFADPIPTTKEAREAFVFCQYLDEHRQSADAYNDEAPEVSDYTYRCIYKGLEKYRPYITDEAKHCFNALEKYIRGRLPEFKLIERTNEYNSQIVSVYQARKEADKKKRKKESFNRIYEDLACNFFSAFLEDKEVRLMPPSVEKLTLYSNALKIVDCLPESKYKRTDKFRLKYQLNETIFNICECLGDNYTLAKINAKKEMEKYENAIENARRHLEQQDTIAGLRARRRRMREEYLYK